MADEPLRVFVPPGSCAEGALHLEGPEAARVARRGARAGDTMLALDDSGWAMTVRLDEVTSERCHGRVVGRAIAPERRTKVTLYTGLLHPADFRRLLAAATAEGVVAFVPVITDRSVVPALGPDGGPEGEGEWPRLVRDAAEASGRGRRPTIGQTMLFDHALDEATRRGTAVVIDPAGGPIDAALAGRPFSLDVFTAPPGGFSPEELARARARELPIVAPATSGDDPVRRALAALEAIYARLESG